MMVTPRLYECNSSTTLIEANWNSLCNRRLINIASHRAHLLLLSSIEIEGSSLRLYLGCNLLIVLCDKLTKARIYNLSLQVMQRIALDNTLPPLGENLPVE